MGNPIRCTWGRYLRGPLETGPWRHSARWCCKQSSKIICKWSESFDCLHSYQLCTINFLSDNCCNQTNRPPIPRARRRVRTLSRPPTNGGEIYGGGGATRKPRTYSKSYFNQTNRHSTPLSQPAIREGHTHRPAPAAPLQPKRPPRPLPPKAPHQWTSGAVIYFQTSPNQHKFKAMTNNFPLIMTLTSR